MLKWLNCLARKDGHLCERRTAMANQHILPARLIQATARISKDFIHNNLGQWNVRTAWGRQHRLRVWYDGSDPALADG